MEATKDRSNNPYERQTREEDPDHHSYRTVPCPACGNLVPSANLQEHLLADARILRLIKVNRPEWTNQDCEDYLRSLSGPHESSAPRTIT